VTPPLTYLEFLAVAVVPAVAGLAVLAWRVGLPRRQQAGIALMLGVAMAYTVPWDNYLVGYGVWYYGEGTVSLTIWNAPLGEYLFIALQTVGVALWVYLALGRAGPPPAFWVGDVARGRRLGGVGAGVAVCVAGLAMLTSSATFYLGAILAWAGPVFALQWGFGWTYLWTRRRVMALAVTGPTLYLWVADRVALELGVWVISPRFTTGLVPAGLPVEEAAFFLVTNLFVAQGLVLLEGVLAAAPDAVDRLSARHPALRVVVERWA
jgi:lycopene cyclase domain-containing protein